MKFTETYEKKLLEYKNSSKKKLFKVTKSEN